MSSIQFFCLKPAPVLRERNRLKSFLLKRASLEKKSIASLNVIFCDDAYLLSINRDFLKHDYYTDIITFDLSPSKKSPIEAEIYISLDRVRENAMVHQTTYKTELHRVIFHGLLHLLGYRDKKQADQLLMRKMEDRLLKAYFKDRDIG